MKKLLTGYILSIFLIGLTGTANATIINIIPTVDQSATSIYNLSGFWGSWTLDSPTNDILRVDFFGGLERRAALEFDVSDIKPGDIINQVWLYLTFIEADASVELSGYAGDGTITASDFGTPAATPIPPNVFLAEFDPVPNAINQINLGSGGITFINSLVGTGNYAGILIRELAIDSNNIFSMETQEPLWRPTLSIEYTSVPEPATMLLLGTGLVGVAGAARRKKKNQA